MNKYQQAGLWVLGVLALVSAGVIVNINIPRTTNLDTFAKCLADKGLTMYGASWCPHCQRVKASFGTSFQYVPYVECVDNPDVCARENIEGYPTWVFKDGRRYEGEQSLQKLSEYSGCPLVHDTSTVQ